MRMPGLGEYEISRLLRMPIEMVEFHLWYLREKRLVFRLDTGQLAISALGVDRIEHDRLRISDDRLLPTGNVAVPPERWAANDAAPPERWEADDAAPSRGALEDGQPA